MKNWRDGIAGKEYGRFEGYGDTPPEKNGDYAWLMQMIRVHVEAERNIRISV